MSGTAASGHVNRGEFRSGPISGTALISAATFHNKPARYADVDGWAIFEGDIVLGRVDDLKRIEAAGRGPVLESIGITGPQFRWPNATVPYDIDPAMPDQQRVTDAIAYWEAHTPLRFVRRAAGTTDFVMFQSGGGCSSQVGRRGGQQPVTLGQGCTTGNAIHEIGHTIGLWHEQSREDRDTFVRIVWANIDPSMQHNFTQHITDGDDLGAYDYGSIMHYPRDAFSSNGQDTIVPKQTLPPGVVMGQRTALSAGDLAGVATMYPGQPTLKEATKDPIVDTTLKEARKEPTTDTVKELGKDPIVDTTLKEVRKEPITDTVKEVRKDPIVDTTLKEVRKEPITDTVKEAGKDPIRDTIKETVADPVGPGPVGPQPGPLHVSPFVLAAPSRAGVGGAGDPVAEAAQQVQQIEDAIAQAEQQLAQLLQAYDEAVHTLQALQGGQGPA